MGRELHKEIGLIFNRIDEKLENFRDVRNGKYPLPNIPLHLLNKCELDIHMRCLRSRSYYSQWPSAEIIGRALAHQLREGGYQITKIGGA